MGLLEEKSLWHHYKSKVWPEESEQTHSLHSILRTLRSIHGLGELAYISVPITSGRVLYDELNKTLIHPDSKDFLTGPASSAEKNTRVPRFKEIIKTVIATNYAEGNEFLRDLQKRVQKPILFPADLFPRGEKWSQDHFQALWTSIIGELCTEIHMSKNWEYSNGAVEEFTHVYQLQLGIPHGVFGGNGGSPFFNTKQSEKENRERMRNFKAYDHQGNNLSLEEGVKVVNTAITQIKTEGFNTHRLESARDLLIVTGEMIENGFYQ